MVVPIELKYEGNYNGPAIILRVANGTKKFYVLSKDKDSFNKYDIISKCKLDTVEITGMVNEEYELESIKVTLIDTHISTGFIPIVNDTNAVINN